VLTAGRLAEVFEVDAEIRHAADGGLTVAYRRAARS
jgi:hypothetical protein